MDIERDKQTQSTKQPQHMEINKNLKNEVPKEVDLMESRLNTAIGDCSETKVAREGTKRKKKTQTWIEPLPHKEEKKQSGHEGRVKGSWRVGAPKAVVEGEWKYRSAREVRDELFTIGD